MNARIYDPELARFMSADPTIPDPFASQSFNRFSYVNNNPLSFTDPSGLVPLPGASIGYCYGNCPGAYFNYLFYGCFYCVPFPPIPYAGSLGGVAGGDYAPAPHQTDKKTSQDRSWVNTPASLSAAGYSYTPSPSGMTGISGGGAVPAVYSGQIIEVTESRSHHAGSHGYLAGPPIGSLGFAPDGMAVQYIFNFPDQLDEKYWHNTGKGTSTGQNQVTLTTNGSTIRIQGQISKSMGTAYAQLNVNVIANVYDKNGRLVGQMEFTERVVPATEAIIPLCGCYPIDEIFWTGDSDGRGGIEVPEGGNVEWIVTTNLYTGQPTGGEGYPMSAVFGYATVIYEGLF